MNLTDLEILALDCQATGANPSKGQLLEIGWAPYRPGSASGIESITVESFLISLASGVSIPKAVQRLTGISQEHMADSVPEADVWKRLLETGAAVASYNEMDQCPVVIHFSRFELPFLGGLHQKINAGTPFPFQIICTHAIAARLLPDLPRRGLRALSGYFGYSLPKLKRCADHVMATLWIWNALVPLLQDRCDIHTVQQLTEWLADTPLPRRTKRQFPMNCDVRRNLPGKPGIYLMKGADQQVLYVGKAKSLRKRVNSYFRNKAPHAEHILEMLTQAWDLDYCVADSALEAAISESDAIKRFRPQYNISLQPAERRLVFVDKQLSGLSDDCDSQYCVGPIPYSKQLDGMVACSQWIFNEAPFPAGAADLIRDNLFSWRVPELECLQTGVVLFRERHGKRFEGKKALYALLSVGAYLQRLHLEGANAGAQNDDDADEEQHNSSLIDHVWTPQAIADTLDHMMMHAAFLIRRARWFALLCESCLVWGSVEEPGVLKNFIVFENGFVVERGILTGDAQLPLPPGWRRSIRDRRTIFDIATYDRMRVVTTEIRRLIGEDRMVQLCLWPDTVLKPPQLQKLLAWV